MSRFVIAGTDTDVGKTVFSAALASALGASYWKPLQSGLEEVDVETVARLSDARIIPEAWRLTRPLSPHRAAELDGVEIDPDGLTLPDIDGPLIVEAAGGLMVPITREHLYIDRIALWGLPVILCARTTLGTINHSLLSIEALRSRGIALHGLTFIGEDNADNIRTICEMGDARCLGRLPPVEPLTQGTLADAFTEHFSIEDFG